MPDGLLNILKKQKDNRIVLLVVDSAAGVVKRDFGGANIIVEPIKVKWKRSMLQRAGIFFNTYLNLTPLAWLEATMGVRIDEKALRKKKKYPLFLKKFIANTFGKSKWIRIKLAPRIDNFIFSERPYKDLFDKYKPSVVFVPDIFGPQGLNILREAKRQGVKSVGMTASWDHFPKRFEARKPDTLFVWNEVLKKEAMELQDYEEKNIFVVGVPQYDLFVQKEYLLSREEFFKNINLYPDKKLVSFFSSSKRAPDDGDIVDMILKWIKEKKFFCEAQMYIRPYPGVSSDHEKFDKFEGDNLVYIDWIEKKRLFSDGAHAWYPSLDGMIFFMNVLYHSDVIISTYSSVSVEASAFLKPAININFDGYKQRPFEQSIKRSKYKSHFMHVFETNGVRQVESQQELFDSIEKFFKNPDANKENLVKLRDKMCWRIDGKASERIANKI
jgi:hypothetical protein